MDQSFQGDLTDILRGSTNSTSNNNNSGFGDQLVVPTATLNDWHFSSSDHHNTNSYFPSLLEDHHQAPSMTLPDMDPMAFGDPFSNMRDPLGLHGPPGPTSFFGDAASPGPTAFFGLDHHHHQELRPSCNIFSRMLQINPSPAPAVGPTSPAASVAAKSAVGPAQCDINSPSAVAAAASPRGVMPAGDGLAVAAERVAMQISSPRNPGIKRRKSQAKKVVCIPAPAAANSRASGEVVPSDLWAWRKYGQKPIKGSPYPRGYYRCSSSKGCSARKQVERSRTDPNMLVITYTSEHNHPWPTQRNALAGSTRSQPSKTTTSSSSSKTSPITISHSQSHTHQLGQVKTTSTSSSSPKEELKVDNNDNNNASVSTTSASVKEESFDHSDRLDDDDAAFSTDVDHEAGGFGYRPSLCSNVVVHGNNNDHDAFFADLGEIEADPLKLLFSQGFASSVDHQQQHHKGLMVTGDNNNSTNNINDNKGLDPYAMFDWSESNNDEDNKQSN